MAVEVTVQPGGRGHSQALISVVKVSLNTEQSNSLPYINLFTADIRLQSFQIRGTSL